MDDPKNPEKTKKITPRRNTVPKTAASVKQHWPTASDLFKRTLSHGSDKMELIDKTEKDNAKGNTP